MYEKARKTLLVPKAKVSKMLPPPPPPPLKHGLLGFFKLLIWLTGKHIYCFLICQEFTCCMLTSWTSFQGVLPVKKYRGAHDRYFSMTQRYGKRKNLHPKIWVSVSKVFVLVNQPSSIFAIRNFKILFLVLIDVQQRIHFL